MVAMAKSFNTNQDAQLVDLLIYSDWKKIGLKNSIEYANMGDHT